MKTQFLLDRQELAELGAGKPFTLEVGNGVVIILRAEEPFTWRSAAKKELSTSRRKKSGKKKRRKNASVKERKGILLYAAGHGLAKAAARYGVRRALILDWRRREK